MLPTDAGAYRHAQLHQRGGTRSRFSRGEVLWSQSAVPEALFPADILSIFARPFPDKLAAYQQRYASNAYVSAEYRKRMRDLVASVCSEHKLGKHYDDMPSGESADKGERKPVEIQPWLPFSQEASGRKAG